MSQPAVTNRVYPNFVSCGPASTSSRYRHKRNASVDLRPSQDSAPQDHPAISRPSVWSAYPSASCPIDLGRVFRAPHEYLLHSNSVHRQYLSSACRTDTTPRVFTVSHPLYESLELLPTQKISVHGDSTSFTNILFKTVERVPTCETNQGL